MQVGPSSPGAVVSTRGGDIELGFEVYPLDGAPQGALPASRLHLTEASLGATPGYTVTSLTSTPHHLNPNPITKQEGATFFSGTGADAYTLTRFIVLYRNHKPYFPQPRCRPRRGPWWWVRRARRCRRWRP